MGKPLLSMRMFQLQNRISLIFKTQYKMTEEEQVMFLADIARMACEVHQMEVFRHDQEMNNCQRHQVIRRPHLARPANDIGGLKR